MTRPHRGVTVPSMPPVEELEARAASAAPTAEGCWWATAQASAHVLGAPARRDARNGDILPQPLLDVLASVARIVSVATRPLPTDPIQLAAGFLAEPLRHILHRGRSRIVRAHVQQPLHQLREMDAACMDWLGRRPGRNVREKLAGRASALVLLR